MTEIDDVLANSKLDEALARGDDAKRVARISLWIGIASMVISLAALFWRI